MDRRDDPDRPFTSDGCSWFPDLWMRECCRSHDYAYWAGHDRLTADLDFLKCVAKSSSRLGPFRYIFAGVIVTGMALGRPIRDIVIKCKKMDIGQIQQKIHQVAQHADEAIGYGTAATLTTAPVWISTLTPYLQFAMLIIGMGVGISTWRLNRAKRKSIEKNK